MGALEGKLQGWGEEEAVCIGFILFLLKSHWSTSEFQFLLSILLTFPPVSLTESFVHRT